MRGIASPMMLFNPNPECGVPISVCRTKALESRPGLLECRNALAPNTIEYLPSILVVSGCPDVKLALQVLWKNKPRKRGMWRHEASYTLLAAVGLRLVNQPHRKTPVRATKRLALRRLKARCKPRITQLTMSRHLNNTFTPLPSF